MQLTRAHTDRRRWHSARPRFDHLEERTLLSTWTVTDNSDSPTDTGSLRYAILNEPSGTTINFAPSVTSPITLTHGALDITTDLDIEGPGAESLTVAGNHQSAVFKIGSGVTATIAGLTIAHGKAFQGGGIANLSGTLALEGCTIANNHAASGQGGGIFNTGTLRLIDSTVANNEADSGGGIDNGPGANAILTDSTLANNSARGTGGGIESRGMLSLVNCTVSANSAKTGGGVFRAAPRAG